MLYIHFNNQVPNEKKFEYSIMGNNQVDVVKFDVSNVQLDFEPTNIYVKVQTKDKRYVDKIALTDESGTLTWNLLAKTTAHKVVECQLSFEDRNGNYYQTEMFELTLKPNINADGTIENDYPSVLQDFEKRIEALEQGGGGSSGNHKTIFVELLPSIIGINTEKCFRSSLRLNLVNFGEEDIGSFIYLYRKSFGNKKNEIIITDTKYNKTRLMAYKHPKNWDSEATNIAGLGYGVIAGRSCPMADGDKYAPVPEYMYHNGFVQTEYEITREHVEQKYMDIDVGKEFISFLMPCLNEMDKNYDEETQTWNLNSVQTIGGGKQLIAFYQVKNGKIECYPKNSISARCQRGSDTWDIVDLDDNEEYRLTQNFEIKILPY